MPSRTAQPSRAPRIVAALALLFALALAAVPLALAQDAPIPQRFTTLQSDVDLPGGDLQSIFDVTLERCMAACLRDGACTAFTFNARNGSCFLKDAPGDAVPFVDAISGRVTDRDAAALAMARDAAADLGFLDAWDLDEARAQAATLAQRYPADGRTEAEWLDLASRQAPAAAVASIGAAVAVADSGNAWLAHARAFADLAAVERNRAWEHDRQATLAAINAALRLPEPARADAIMELARALEATYRGEGALAAVRLADHIAPGIAPDELLRLREAFGFRVIYVDVDARTGTPRICAAFSEDLAPARDYAPFVQRTAPGLAVEVEGSQLCVTGVAYGERYTLTLRAGLPSASGDALVRDVPIDQYVRDRAPAVRFPGQAYVLPARGPRALPVETVNANELELRLLRVTDRNLVAAIREGSFLRSLGPWEGARFEDLLTELVWEGDASLAGELNRTTTSRLPLDAVGPLDPGIYVLRANVAGTDEWDVAPAMQWFLVSDLGVTTLSGTDAVHVVVQRLSDGQPAEGLRVALIARSNRVLGEATTDAQGLATFAGGLARGTGNAAPALVLVEDADDLAVLSLEEAEFDLSDRGVEGRPAPGPIDVFLTPDRGAYRPGETIHLTALVRDGQARAIAGLPLTVRLMRPDGVEHARVLASETGAGGFVVALPLAGGVPRGVWRIATYADPDAPPLATRTVLVEDFLPERVDVALTLPEGLIAPFAAPPLEVEARYLFGAPAAGLTLTGDVAVAPTDALPGWPDYVFGRFDQRVDTQRFPFAADLRTDADGHLTTRLPLDRLDVDARPYALTVTATLVDGASRPVERTLARTLRPIAPVVGIRPSFDGPLPENAEAAFDLVLVDPDGDATAGEVRWQVDRVETRYQWYAVDGRWYWEPVTERQRVAEGVVLVTDGPARVAVPVEWGPYEIRATYEGPTWVASAVTLDVQTADDGRLFVITSDNQLVALAEEDGSVLWRHRGITESAGILAATSPAISGPTVIAPYSSGELYAIRVENGNPVWNDSLTRTGNMTSLTELSDIAGRPVIDAGQVFAISHAGRLVSIDERTGERVWTRDIAGVQTPWVSGGFIFLVNLDAQLIALSRRDGRIRWITQLQRYRNEERLIDPIQWSGPVLAGERLLLVSSQGVLARVSPYTGELTEQRELPDGAYIPPVVAKETVYILTDDAELIALR